MRAAVYRGPNDLRTETVPVPKIGRHELLVKVATCGVCPTDIKKIQHGTVLPPRIFGHETAGTIVQIGGNNSKLETPNSKLSLGDRVALHHHVPCMGCHYCRHHAFAQCAQYKRTGITAGFEPAGGGFAEYVRIMPFVLGGVVKIPAKNTFEEGAMLEPVNTVLKAINRLNLLPGDNVLVAGQGPIGLMFTRLLQLRGINVLATDLLDSRLKLAKQLGARWAVKPNEAARVNLSKRAAKIPNPKLETQNSKLVMDAAILAVPSDAALHQAFGLVRGAGQILLFAHTKRPQVQSPRSKVQSPAFTTHAGAISPSPLRSGGAGRGEEALRAQGESTHSALRTPHSALYPTDLSTICVDEKDLLGSYSADFTLQREVARLVFTRQLDVRKLITHRFPLEQTTQAVNLAAHPTPESLKILVG